MNGYRRAAVYSLDGDWLYSVYTRPHEGPFVHALNLEGQFALCIDLPFPTAPDFEADLLWSMALSGDGKMLYAINGMTGQVAQIDASNGYTVRQSATLTWQPAATGQGPISNALAGIGRWLARRRPEPSPCGWRVLWWRRMARPCSRRAGPGSWPWIPGNSDCAACICPTWN